MLRTQEYKHLVFVRYDNQTLTEICTSITEHTVIEFDMHQPYLACLVSSINTQRSVRIGKANRWNLTTLLQNFSTAYVPT